MTKWVSKISPKYVEKRDWPKYNEELVLHGEFLLDFEWINKGWQEELAKMNYEKKGAPFKFPNSLIELQAVWAQIIDYREVEGITRKVCEASMIPDFNDYSTIFRRVNKLETNLVLPENKTLSIVSDGSGMKFDNAGEYRKNKYGENSRKKFLKVIVTANPITKELLDCDVFIDDEDVSEPDISQTHMEKLIEQGFEINQFFGDGAFDKKKLFNFLQKHNIESGIKIRSNASGKADGSMRRAREVKIYKTKGYVEWAKKKKYGLRWIIEVIFSAVKTKFGEKNRSKKPENCKKEAKRKFWAYQKIKNYTTT